jgi:hypothetical protein
MRYLCFWGMVVQRMSVCVWDDVNRKMPIRFLVRQ